MKKSLRKWLWRSYYRAYYKSWANGLHYSVAYILVADVEINGEKRFMELGLKRYEKYIIEKAATTHLNIDLKTKKQ